jgi:hypothetical protein
MVVNVQQIERGLSEYIEREIAQKAVGVQKFTVYFLMPQITKKVSDTLTGLQNNKMFAEIFDENGNVELDAIYNQAKEAIRKTGQIEAYGIVFRESDVDSLYRYIANTGE